MLLKYRFKVNSNISLGKSTEKVHKPAVTHIWIEFIVPSAAKTVAMRWNDLFFNNLP